MKIFGVIFGGIGVICLGIALLLYVSEAFFLSRAELTTGTVASLHKSPDIDGGGYTYCPVFQFTAPGGQTVSHLEMVCSSPAAFKVGQQVELYYDRQNPDNVQMNNFWAKYTGVFVPGLIGMIFALIGVFSLLGGLVKRTPGRRAGSRLG